MKSMKLKSTIAAAAAITLLSSVMPAKAARIRLEGSGFYDVSTQVRFFPGGRQQGGRYSNLGSDFYRRTTIGMEWIVNRSNFKSGNLSFEFWGMPFFGADQGVVLMTRGLRPMTARRMFRGLQQTGWGIFLDEVRFPEINVSERVRRGWAFRDALSFRRRNLL
jgi:hypothetical protein